MYLSTMNEHIISINFLKFDLMQIMVLTQKNFFKEYIDWWIEMFKMNNIMVKKTQG